MTVEELIKKLNAFQNNHTVVIQDKNSKREVSIEEIKWLYNGCATIIINCELFIPNN